ncbi:hypothetical protein [Patulibacter defluvii]|uniref:hypothetical protein n=1 Tax=Patulibacter defluvii TaxID=3095358 RepID=UPI002A75A84E|nr:hypothetical protein [Patulibacter sp. DM4]
MSPIDETTRQRLARAGEALLERFGHDRNITGVGVGYRRRGGLTTDEPVVTVMVRKKRRPSLLSRARLIPRRIEVDGQSCATDVLQAQAVPFADTDGIGGPQAGKLRPLKAGRSVSNKTISRERAGTIGCFVRDNTDGTINILTANHVIAVNDKAPTQDPVLQPGLLDAPLDPGYNASDPNTLDQFKVGKLKRYVPIVGGATAVDVALAQLDPGVAYVAESEGIGSITTTEKAAGMIVAGDGFGNVWLASMANTLSAINGTIMVRSGNANVVGTSSHVAPSNIAKGTVVRKSGRSTGVTTGVVMSDGATESISVNAPGIGVVTYTNLIWTQWLGAPGDSGAVATTGGVLNQVDSSGLENPVPQPRITKLIRDRFDSCEVLGAIQGAFDVPITGDRVLSDRVRDDFLAQSIGGRFLITLCYLNTNLIQTRLAQPQSAQDQAYAQAWYDEYQPAIAEVMSAPDPENTRRLDVGEGYAYDGLINMLKNSGVLTAGEATAAMNFKQANENTLYMYTRGDLNWWLNQPDTLQQLVTTAKAMPSLTLVGQAKTLSGLD